MRKITRECLHCSNPVTGIPDKDNLGYYMYCLDCNASFDVDVVNLEDLRKYISKLTPDKFYDKHFQNCDIFVCYMFVDNELRDILDCFFDKQDDLTLSPFIKILFDIDYIFNETDDLAYVIELHLSEQIIRITDLMLNNTLKTLVQTMKKEFFESEKEIDNMEKGCYVTKFYITEPNLDDKFIGESHDYIISTDHPITVKETQDIIFQACEIERIYSGKIYVEKQVEKNGEYFDHDEWVCEVNMKTTDELTPYIDWLKCNSTPIYKIDRKKSTINVLD